MSDTIRVGIADMNVCIAPNKITTLGLGSCVGVVLYDMNSDIAGLVHIMLPDSTKIKENKNKCKFADTGIDELVKKLESMGLLVKNLSAKIAGGAKMFDFSNSSPLGSIGDKNVEAVRAKLKALGIRIKSEDVGLNYGRTIVFDPITKELSVIKAGQQVRII